LRQYRTRLWGLSLIVIAVITGGLAQTTVQTSSPAMGNNSIPDSTAQNAVLSPSLNAGEKFADVTVGEIGFRGLPEDAKIQQQLRGLVLQETGRPLDRAKVRRSILSLYSTGRFADLRVEAERRSPKEIALIFIAEPNFFIGPVSVIGTPKHPTENQLANAAKLELGEMFTLAKMSRAVSNMKLVLSENGFYQAEITHQEHYDDETQLVSITFVVEAKEPARVGKITIEGSSDYPVKTLEKVAHLSPGDTVTSERITRALQHLRKTFQKQGRLEAQVAIVARTYRPETNTLDYTFKIDGGSEVAIRVEGVKMRRGLLKKFIPLFQENAVDDDLLNEGRRNLRDYFQSQGYFQVKVTYSKEYDQPRRRLDVVYVVDRGRSHNLVAVKIEGNNYFSDDVIRERMGVHPASGFLTHGFFSQSQLATDLQSVENLYKANGFLGVKVASEVKEKVDGNGSDMAVVVHITEGPQTKVASLTIAGNRIIKTQEIRDRVQSLEQQPFSEARLAEDRDAILNYYYNSGFSDVQLDTNVTPAANDPQMMNVVYTVKEGRRVFVNRILLLGLHYTRPYVVNRSLEVATGDPLSQLGLLDSQRNLYDLGLFNEVDAAVQNPEGDAQYKDVLFEMHEAKRWTFNYGVGFEVQTGGQSLNADQINTAPAPGVNVPPNTTPPQGTVSTANPQPSIGISPRVSFDVTRLNFRGRDHTLLFKTSLSNLSRRALVSYDAPNWFDNHNLRLTFTAFADNTRDIRTFAAERIEGSVQAEQVVSKVTRLLYRFQYRLVKVDQGTLVISPELVPLLSKPVRVGLPSFTYIRDKRDDPLDTHKGNYTTFDAGVAAGVFGSAANFSRFLIQNSTFTPIKRRFVLARSTRIGVQETFGKGDAAVVPLPERFYAGGAQSERGFALNQAGPRDLFTGFPVGGNAVFMNQIELRMPPFPMPLVGDNVSFVLFHDSGNVFSDGQEMVKSLFRWNQPNREACSSESSHLLCGFSYMSQALGLGARYKTPVGPLRVDVSYNLNPTSFPFYVQCPSVVPTGNNAGPCATLPPSALIFQSGTLRHFNFFFSIGQSF
jgi:outer membrane protein insertion porin family